MPLSGVRLFQRITSLPGPARGPANLDCRRSGPDDFRLMAPPAGASIPESNVIISYSSDRRHPHLYKSGGSGRVDLISYGAWEKN